MSDFNKKILTLATPALVVVIIDQVTKYMIRTTPRLQDLQIIKGWLAFHYTQNPGMALGMDWAATPVISVIAIVATLGILVYILKSLDRANLSYLFCMGLILGGALGNILDRLFLARLESYGGFLDGHVVDFIHFTLMIDGHPVFPYIFNFADVAISTSIILLLLFHKRILPAEVAAEKEEEARLHAEMNAAAREGASLSTADEEK